MSTWLRSLRSAGRIRGSGRARQRRSGGGIVSAPAQPPPLRRAFLPLGAVLSPDFPRCSMNLPSLAPILFPLGSAGFRKLTCDSIQTPGIATRKFIENRLTGALDPRAMINPRLFETAPVDPSEVPAHKHKSGSNEHNSNTGTGYHYGTGGLVPSLGSYWRVHCNLDRRIAGDPRPLQRIKLRPALAADGAWLNPWQIFGGAGRFRFPSMQTSGRSR